MPILLNTEDPNIPGLAERGERERVAEIKQLRGVWRSCTKDNVNNSERYGEAVPKRMWKQLRIILH